MCSKIVLKWVYKNMFHFQNRTDKLICVRTSFTLPKKRGKKTENERFGFLHSKKTQNKNHQSKK